VIFLIDYSLESLQRLYGKPIDHISYSYTKWMGRYERYGSVIEWLRDHNPLWGEIAEAVNEYVRREWNILITVHKVAKRVKLYLKYGMRVTLVFATDHDPSGLDINGFYMAILRFKWGLEENVKYYRLMLNMDRIERLKLSPYPAKVRDPRYKWYVRAFGEGSWEVDALEKGKLFILSL